MKVRNGNVEVNAVQAVEVVTRRFAREGLLDLLEQHNILEYRLDNKSWKGERAWIPGFLVNEEWVPSWSPRTLQPIAFSPIRRVSFTD